MTTQTLTLTEFLLARIAEDEETARAATPGPWRASVAFCNVPPGDPDWDTPASYSVDCRPMRLRDSDNEAGFEVIPVDAWQDAEVWGSIAIWDVDDHYSTKYDVGADHSHIARHDPARVLAECDAKRRIVAAHPLTGSVIPEGYVGRNEGFGCETCHDWDGVTEALGNCDTLLALALVYAEHPDYRDEWKP